MRILIVGDEPNIRRTLSMALEGMGHAVEEVASAPKALRPVEWRSSPAVRSPGSATGLTLTRALIRLGGTGHPRATRLPDQ